MQRRLVVVLLFPSRRLCTTTRLNAIDPARNSVAADRPKPATAHCESALHAPTSSVGWTRSLYTLVGEGAAVAFRMKGWVAAQPSVPRTLSRCRASEWSVCARPLGWQRTSAPPPPESPHPLYISLCCRDPASQPPPYLAPTVPLQQRLLPSLSSCPVMLRACLLSVLVPLLLLSLSWFAIHFTEHNGSSIVATLAGAHDTPNTPVAAAASTPAQKKTQQESKAAAAALASNTATTAYHDAKCKRDQHTLSAS